MPKRERPSVCYFTLPPLLLRRFQSTQSQLVTRKDWWSSPRAWSQWIRVNWPYYKSTYLRKLLTKPKKGQLQLCCRFPSPESFHTLGWESLPRLDQKLPTISWFEAVRRPSSSYDSPSSVTIDVLALVFSVISSYAFGMLPFQAN